jgi:pyruvate,water dikinase
VPPGFAVTSAAFHGFVEHHGLEDYARKRNWSSEEVDKSRALFLDRPIPPAVSRAIAKAYKSLGGCVAVRSSMIGEDSATASCAGQLDTTLDAQGNRELLESVKRCWASIFSQRLVTYLNDRETLSSRLGEDFAVAVVVQRMVEAEAAGVAFSADPLTGQRCVVIEAVPAVGEAPAQGEVEPDRYTVDARGELTGIDSVFGRSPVLEDEQILQFAELAHDVACRASDPQDVEWAWVTNSLKSCSSRAWAAGYTRWQSASA